MHIYIHDIECRVMTYVPMKLPYSSKSCGGSNSFKAWARSSTDVDELLMADAHHHFIDRPIYWCPSQLAARGSHYHILCLLTNF